MFECCGDSGCCSNTDEIEGPKIIQLQAVGMPEDTPLTPRQRKHLSMSTAFLLESINKIDVPGGGPKNIPVPEKLRILGSLYRRFLVELEPGISMTQIDSSMSYSPLDVKLSHDDTSLILDQHDGRKVEFPLTMIQRILKMARTPHHGQHVLTFPVTPDALNIDEDVTTRHQSRSTVPPSPGSTPQPMYLSETTQLSDPHYVTILEFEKRKLAFVFATQTECDSFEVCIQLLSSQAAASAPTPR
eukprot:GHVP01035693.1.p1 GENE.GHVP01035693.1~~GHVP01035693.1.p1  ORF type:complete len:244 (+),score=43.90 GHVP01035693.1:120-851(+)